MQFGFETVLWGDPFQTPIPQVFDLIRQAGFEGVEYGQQPRAARRCKVRTCADLARLAGDAGLRLVGLGTGSARTYDRFCGSERGQYLICYNWTLEFRELLDKGYRIALHPRVFRSIQRFADVAGILEDHRESTQLGAILDTAHLYLAGENPVAAIRDFVAQFGTDRLFAVHLKDWTGEFGRSLYWHTRGFTRLGAGEVPVLEVLQALRDLEYVGPAVVDLDNLWLDPQPTLFQCAEWLHDHGFLNPLPTMPQLTGRRSGRRVLSLSAPHREDSAMQQGDQLSRIGSEQDANLHPSPFVPIAMAADLKLWRAILRAARPPAGRFYSLVVDALYEWGDSLDSVTLRVCGQSQNTLRLLAWRTASKRQPELVVPISTSASGVALEEGAAVVRFPPTRLPARRKFYSDGSTSPPTEEHELITVPIRVSGSPTFFHLLINLYRTPQSRMLPTRPLAEASHVIGLACDWVHDAECSAAVAAVHRLVSELRAQPLPAFLEAVCTLVKERLVVCAGVSMWIPDAANERLEMGGDIGTRWDPTVTECFYVRGQGLTGYCWEHKEVLLGIEQDLRHQFGKQAPRSRDSGYDDTNWILFVPLVDDKGVVQAIIRCNDKLQVPHSNTRGMFSYEDASVVDAVGQAIIPHIREVRAETARARRLGELSHELRRPVSSILGHSQTMLDTPNLPEELQGAVTKLRRRTLEFQLLAQNAELVRSFPHPVSVQQTPLSVAQDVVGPVLREWEPILRARGLQSGDVWDPTTETVPELFLDGAKLELVLKNLLHNALRATEDSPRVQVSWHQRADQFELVIRDWGRGLPGGEVSALVRPGVCDPERPGESLGLGLWVADQVMQAHGGRIEFRNSAHPTEVVLVFPLERARRPHGVTAVAGPVRSHSKKGVYPSGSRLRFGFSTIAWGSRFESREQLEAALGSIARQGFSGVEFFQGPGAIGGIGSIHDLLKVLGKHGLEFIGMFGGTDAERRTFFAGSNTSTWYWATVQWDQDRNDAESAPFASAIHAHAFRPGLQHQAAVDLLRRDRGIRYLPDTAHLLMEGHDPADELRALFREEFRRDDGCRHPIAAVHLKDCRIGPGRISHRYPRGFTELGEGDVPLQGVLHVLEEAQFDGWVVVEVNVPTLDVEHSLVQCANFLRAQGYPLRIRREIPLSGPTTAEPVVDPALEKDWVTALLEASVEEPRECYRQILEAACKLFHCKMATWAVCSLQTDELTVAAIYPAAVEKKLTHRTFLARGSLSEPAIRYHRVEFVEGLEVEEKRRKLVHRELVESLGVTMMIILPILNTYNPHHVRCVLQLYPSADCPALEERQWFRLAQMAARAVEASVESCCARLVARVQYLAVKHPDLEGYLQALVCLVKSTLDCNVVTLFLVDALARKLECPDGGSTNLTWWSKAKRDYYMGERWTAETWKRKRPIIYRRDPCHPPLEVRSSDLPDGSEPDSVLLAPVFDHRGGVVGVIRCSNGIEPRAALGLKGFTDEDLALLEVILRTAVSHILFLRGVERRKEARPGLQHVLKQPVSAMRKDLDDIRTCQRRLCWWWPHPYPLDVQAWCSRLGQLAEQEADVTVGGFLNRSQVHLCKDVVVPIVTQMKQELEGRDILDFRFDYNGLRSLPDFEGACLVHLHIVMFNLLENAVKYAHPTRERVRVELDWEPLGDDYAISISDDGIGIPADCQERVFEKEFRGETAKNLDREGQGLGLNFVREAMARLGGRVAVTHCAEPTTITLYIPAALAARGPE